MKSILTVILVLCFNLTYGQDSCKFYFDKYNIQANKDIFNTCRTVIYNKKNDSLVLVKEYYNNGTLKLVGQYIKLNKDSLPDLSVFNVYSVNEKYRKEGVFRDWNENGSFNTERKYTKDNMPEIRENEEKVFIAVEENATFLGGSIDNVRKYVSQNLKYPEKAWKNNIQGKVVVQFTVNSNGKVVDVKILHNVDPTLDRESVRIVEAMPKWKPGRNNGKRVAQKFVFPIIFKLKN